VWFQNARAKYRRNTLKQEQQERNGNGSGSVHQVSSGDGGIQTVGDHSAAATSPGARGQRASQRGPSRSPASLSDLSSTPSTTNDAQPPIGATATSGQTALIMMDFDRRQAAMVDSAVPMFGSPGFLVDNC